MDAPLGRLLPARPGTPPDLERRLRALCDEARAPLPELGLSDEDFLRHVGERLPEGEPLGDALAALCAADLYLACACLRGAPAAQRRLDEILRSHAPGWLRAVGPELAPEVAQQLGVKLLVGDGEAPPKLAGYAGRGPLLGWLRVAAVRTALNLRRSQGRADRPTEDAAEQAARRLLQEGEGLDPELAFVKRHYREAFTAAVTDAVRALPVEQRNVLRMYLVGGLSAERIGAVLGVHQSTVSRWMAAARTAIHDDVRAALNARLRLSPAEFESLAGALRSQIDLSLGGLLRDGDGEG